MDEHPEPISLEEIEARQPGLDDLLWQRVLRLVLSNWPKGVFDLPPQLQAYYGTRLFEWASQWDGPDAFFREYAALIPLVGEGYRRLGVDTAAAAFEALIANPIVELIVADSSFTPTEVQSRELAEGVEAVGWNHDQRLDFVASNARCFCV